MNKTAFLFSGQGSQYEKMGQELLAIDSDLNSIIECANDILGFDIKSACLNYSLAELSQTSVAQPAIMTVSLLGFTLAQKLGIEPSCVAGHSLGEYAAMVSSKILSVEDGYKVIKARAKAMQDCAQNQDGAMCAVLGLESSEIEKVCNEIDGYVVPVNYNSPAQTVIAGESDAIEKAMAKFGEMGKKCIKLAVNAAFHSKLMQPAADEFVKQISSIKFNQPQVDFYSNVTGNIITDVSDMPAYLATHLVSPVKFVDELQNIQNSGCETFIEFGPNKVLTGLVKKTLKGVTAINVENEKTYQKLVEIANA